MKAFGYPVLPALYLLANAGLMVILLVEKPLYTWPGLLIVACGDTGVLPLAAAACAGPRGPLDFPGPALHFVMEPLTPACRPPSGEAVGRRV